MQAFRVALDERNFRVLDLLISLTQQMVEGELLQMETLGRPVTEQEYNDLIYRKTACLFEVSMRLGSVLAKVNGKAEAAMGEYGHALGVAFQDRGRRARPHRKRRSSRQARRQRPARG